ncbi:hypothetical protein [Acinetobacter phage Ab69]|nr:hypothetical protein [Acinetobacter phage Ab69]
MFLWVLLVGWAVVPYGFPFIAIWRAFIQAQKGGKNEMTKGGFDTLRSVSRLTQSQVDEINFIAGEMMR